MRYKFAILGAGPSGLVFARQLQLLGEESFIILEKENAVGGLCRSAQIDGVHIDIGGGHFLDTRSPYAVKFLFTHLPPKSWRRYRRVSKILLDGRFIDYPLESNLWQFPEKEMYVFLESIARAKSASNSGIPNKFSDWIRWKLGDAIAESYLLPYNRKLWMCDLDSLGIYWLSKLPSVSYEETRRSCFLKKPFGTIPAHKDFYYPIEGGYGAVWEKIADRFRDRILLANPVTSVEGNVLNSEIEGEIIINTIPWTQWPNFCDLPKQIRELCNQLKFVSIDIDYHESKYETDAQWVYCPDLDLPYHRVLVMNNFGCSKTCFWTESNSLRSGNQRYVFRHTNTYAYPVPTLGKPMVIKNILAWFSKRKIYGLGRWGEWDHYNSDVCVLKAIALANRLKNGR